MLYQAGSNRLFFLDRAITFFKNYMSAMSDMSDAIDASDISDISGISVISGTSGSMHKLRVPGYAKVRRARRRSIVRVSVGKAKLPMPATAAIAP